MSRLSGSGIEPLTVLVAEQLCSSLVLSNEGQRNVHHALSQLHAFKSFGDAVWFGLGVQHITRKLAQTREGLGCVALYAFLAETRSEEFSALILSHFVQLTAVPRLLNSSLGQWRKLVEACSGCLAKSNFKDVVRDFMDPYRPYERHDPPEDLDPEDIAKALQALAKVSCGKLDSVIFTGGPDCAWLGAVSEWLLRLSVVIESADGSAAAHFGRCSRQNTRPQVKISYAHNNRPISSTQLTVKHIYRVKDVSDIIRQQLQPDATQLCIRVPWDTALRSTFGDQALQILTTDLRTVFITAVGSIAQLFTYIATANSYVDRLYLRHNVHYLEGTHGRGFYTHRLSMLSRDFQGAHNASHAIRDRNVQRCSHGL